ncbi:DEAD/DEAH box helicase [Rarobacter incanus]|uniref:ATP-dependent RNA helicase HelY n=1 Tax=Rarobacter incanus TaxID=153494 RepID=A0A542SMG7_9MICO|nr:DEAD/DEAH box helicase [Rarobacter incanus]TQK75675.1 ATP-dependent RNA helicase HelY [Rarobacter incanus]
MTEPTPAQRYEHDRRRRAFEKSESGRFAANLPYPLDDFQIRGCQSIERGAGVLVAAPTGAGKTVVGEFAVHIALVRGQRAFYTTPIKALSNQKYHDLVRAHGRDNVGLLTGDVSVNGDAPVVVMTTEVLRNMLYASSPGLDNLGYVILDEVHYLADRFRGPVWEEIILHLAQSVQIVALSATVSNIEEFGSWLAEVRGDIDVIVSDHRPVPLWQHIVTRRGGSIEAPGALRLVDLYSYREGVAHADQDSGFSRGAQAPQSSADLPLNPELAKFQGRRGAEGRGNPRRNNSGGKVSRFSVVDLLADADLLPAIYFIFSRQGCEAAVDQCLAAGITLTTPREQFEIREIAEAQCLGVPAGDLSVLHFESWLQALERGIAAHHAGMLPLFKEIVEQLFSQGLVKVVFATETLALGINMPARTVVLEKLVKWDGSGHVALTAGEYTQLTGRAGRRGIDVEGHAVVVDHMGFDPTALAGLAGTRTYPLTSSFRPTYNMSANLIATVGDQRTRDILEMSLAQFQADRGVVGLARQAAEQQRALDGYREAAQCDRGNFLEYMELRAELSRAEKQERKDRNAQDRRVLSRKIERLRRGDVIAVRQRRRSTAVAVLGGPEITFEGARVPVLWEGRFRMLAAGDAPDGFDVVGRMRLPRGFNPRKASHRTEVMNEVRAIARGAQRAESAPTTKRAPGGAQESARVTELRGALRAHPCHGCPERTEHERWARRYMDLSAEHARLTRRIQGRTGSIVARFDAVCKVLLRLGYIERTGTETRLSDAGALLRRIYSEKDLLIAQCLRQGIWAHLSAPQLAAVVATAVFDGRREGGGGQHVPGGPTGRLAYAIDDTFRVWSAIAEAEVDSRLDPTPKPELGLAGPMFRWAAGRTLEATLGGTEMAAGDFVRWSKQVLDVLDQIASVAPQPKLRATSLAAMDAVRRGVVAYSGV